MPKESFVATATAIGLLVDVSRMPVYIATEGRQMLQLALPMLVAIAGVAFGTVAGARVMQRVPERWFRRLVAVVLAALGVAMLRQAFR